MMPSADGKLNTPDHLLARASAIFAAALLTVSLGLVWFKVGGGSKGRAHELTGFQSFFAGFGGTSSARPRGGFALNGLLAGTVPFVIIVLTIIALVILALVPGTRGARPAGVLFSALTILLPIVMTLMTFTIMRSGAIQPALWVVFVASVTGLCASIAISSPSRSSDSDSDSEETDTSQENEPSPAHEASAETSSQDDSAK